MSPWVRQSIHSQSDKGAWPVSDCCGSPGPGFGFPVPMGPVAVSSSCVASLVLYCWSCSHASISFPFVWIGWARMATLFLFTIFPWSVRTRYDLLVTGSRTWAGLHLVILSLTCHSKIGSQWLRLSSSLAPLLYPLTILCLSPLAAAISSKSGFCTSSASSSCGEQWDQSLSRALEIRVSGSSPL